MSDSDRPSARIYYLPAPKRRPPPRQQSDFVPMTGNPEAHNYADYFESLTDLGKNRPDETP